ncbi:ferredoxin [Roseovarius sp. LXJ103]|nr:ferredoxin [Roseovarius carneus]PWE37284.1 ferredoxin [Pelagicola sp. LXJ1103]
MTLEDIARTAEVDALSVMGALHENGGTVVLLGPSQAFWPMLQGSAEMLDGCKDQVDRWSLRVVTRMARALNAEPLFPFGGPPYLPFLRWAMDSGRAWQSPAGMLVHDTAGLMVSYRGALRFDYTIILPAPVTSPCTTCEGQPCMSACPVDALSAEQGYNVDACHAYLDTSAGQDCMSLGCRARRACPVSQSFDRDPEQSALHMRSFHKT